MSGDFNVGVAAFGQADAQGGVVASKKGRDLSLRVYEVLTTTVQELGAAGFEIEVWGPRETGHIEGASPEERSENAEARAQEIGADLVIYGHLELGDDKTSLVPEFYLSDVKLRDAEEFGGQHEFGTALRVGDDVVRNPVALREIRALLGERTEALAHFVIGLGYYALDRYDEASGYLERAEQSGGWDDTEGKEVLYLFLGTTAARRGDWPLAQEHYARALEIDDRYARAQLGSAQVQYVQARDGCQPGQVDAAGLEAAVDGYERALRGRHPPLADIPTKVELALGRAYLCMSAAQVADHWDDAKEAYQRVIGEHADGNERVKRLAAEAHADMALYVQLTAKGDEQGARRDAIKAYDRAIELTPYPDRRSVFHLWRAQLYMVLGECAPAGEALTEARAARDEFVELNPQAQHGELDAFYERVESRWDTQCPPPQ
jgi:tetratricopeptide (TPR) repeat protein